MQVKQVAVAISAMQEEKKKKKVADQNHNFAISTGENTFIYWYI